MRTKKLATEMGILNAPEVFLFLPLVMREADQLNPPLTTHLVGCLDVVPQTSPS